GDFVHLRGDHSPVLTLCGRNTVQIHEHRRALALAELAERLRPHGAVRDTAFALRFRPRTPAGVDITVFPDGRALIAGTTDTALARSLYARYISA
ncbi:MAG: thiazole biosynthesis adenylyltransferase ThiF, partial [Terriglobales bacterium]